MKKETVLTLSVASADTVLAIIIAAVLLVYVPWRITKTFKNRRNEILYCSVITIGQHGIS